MCQNLWYLQSSDQRKIYNKLSYLKNCKNESNESNFYSEKQQSKQKSLKEIIKTKAQVNEVEEKK